MPRVRVHCGGGDPESAQRGTGGGAARVGGVGKLRIRNHHQHDTAALGWGAPVPEAEFLHWFSPRKLFFVQATTGWQMNRFVTEYLELLGKVSSDDDVIQFYHWFWNNQQEIQHTAAQINESLGLTGDDALPPDLLA
jgi:hypothetical protein